MPFSFNDNFLSNGVGEVVDDRNNIAVVVVAKFEGVNDRLLLLLLLLLLIGNDSDCDCVESGVCGL